jgi:N-acetylmuramic acid 6-phosphate etherase
MTSSTAFEKARQFLEKEKQFHLGAVTCEHPHPKTGEFSYRIQRNTVDGLRSLLEVDQDIPPVARRAFESPEYQALVESLVRCVERGRRICFTGAGASGRLSIILEAMWRMFWREAAEAAPDRSEEYRARAECCISLMTGGDRALIRSVENFEDYQSFGRRQVRDAGLGDGDLIFAFAEEGVVSSVIGSAKEGVNLGCDVFFFYCNPTDLLVRQIERSREAIANPGILKFDLTTGPMALTGSTRMQATSIEMLVTATAIEEALVRILSSERPELVENIYGDRYPEPRRTHADLFEDLNQQMLSDAALGALARAVDLEFDLYRRRGRVTYLAQRYLLDIFSDMTERTPTFMIPPLRAADTPDAPVPWAFAKDAVRNTPEAWINLLKRGPRGLDWTRSDYEAMGADPELLANLPALGSEQLFRFQIGNEPDPSRHDSAASALVWVLTDEEPDPAVMGYFEAEHRKYSKGVILTIGGRPFERPGVESIHIPIRIPGTCFRMFHHLAMKLAFNTISTGTMGKLGRILGNWMIQVDATNKKLTDRAIRIIAHFAGIPYERACRELFLTMENPQVHRLNFAESYVVQTLRRLNASLPVEPSADR